MASSSQNLALISLAVFVFLLQMASPSIAVDDERQLNTNCSGTPDPGFCKLALKSDGDTPGASDPRVLVQNAIDATSSFAGQTLEAIKSLEDQPGASRYSFAQCTMYYRMVIDKDLPAASDALRRGDFKTVVTTAGTTRMRGVVCEDAFSSKPSPMAEYNNKLYSYCKNIISLASGLLH